MSTSYAIGVAGRHMAAAHSVELKRYWQLVIQALERRLPGHEPPPTDV